MVLTRFFESDADSGVVELDALIDVTGAGVSDHGGLTGLSDDDHSIYIFRSPTATTRNIIQGTAAGVTPLVIDQRADQTAHLFNIRDSGGNDGTYVNWTFKTFSFGFDARASLITSVADPVDPQDAATKAYVDSQVGGGGSAGWGRIFLSMGG